MKRSPLFSTLLCVFSLALLTLFASLQKSAGASPAPQQQIETPMATDERLEAPGWWPTKQSASLDDFVGTQECARCHPKIAATQLDTPMARAASMAADSTALPGQESLSRQAGPYTYTITKKGTGITYSVADGVNSISESLGWAFGLGNKGQTYVYQRDGSFYESRMSFFRSPQNLDLTPGHSPTIPQILDLAMGRRLDPDTLRRCFGCHTTASTTRAGFNPSRLVLGVDCEACHGPGAKHAELMDDEKNAEGRQAIFNPKSLGPVAQVDFCGACHRTSYDVFEARVKGVENVRFQPYRLEKSRCWGDGDARLTCIACHDPHQPLVHDPAAYDQKCLACHASSRSQKPSKDHPGKACPAASKNCVTCHMPRVDFPSMHSPFVDHRIRIVHPNSPYPG
jgi:Cytochrome c554 and c-prime